uniref:BHLH domain-containing protein n=1 Tax=Nelumbo nucifera TaxID=4432 RepID=A0A822Z3K7_NELNU|nr:TPA_asm: hypothetical protein HUJ06_006738 [Nelumbo nucifera]
MEKLQGPINPCFLGEHLNLELLEQGEKAFDFTHGSSLISTESFRLEEERKPFAIPSLQDKMPFLQMLQSVESPTFTSLIEPSFQLLLRLQQQKPWGRNNWTEVDPCAQTLEPESCITHDISEAYSPVKSETKITHDISEAHSTVKSETKEPHHPQSSSCLEVVSSACNVGPNSPENCGAENSGTPSNRVDDRLMVKSSPQLTMPAPVTREKRKRKRTRPSKNKEEVETQRMTHIAVERNRRRQMNDHLNALRSLMPTSFIQRVISPKSHLWS